MSREDYVRVGGCSQEKTICTRFSKSPGRLASKKNSLLSSSNREDFPPRKADSPGPESSLSVFNRLRNLANSKCQLLSMIALKSTDSKVSHFRKALVWACDHHNKRSSLHFSAAFSWQGRVKLGGWQKDFVCL